MLQVSGVPRVTFSNPGAPDLAPDAAQRFGPFDSIHRVALEPGWLPYWETHHAVVAPLSEQQVVIIGRRGEPPFFASELTRLAYLVGGADATAIPDQSLSMTQPSAHRTPIAAPLYIHAGRRPPSRASNPR